MAAGELLRLDSTNYGIVYVRPEDVRVISDLRDGTSNVGVTVGSSGLDLTIATDADELAAMFEVNGGMKIARIN